MSIGKRKMLDEQIRKEEELDKNLPKRIELLEKSVDVLFDMVEKIMNEEKKKWKMQMDLNKSTVREITKLKERN